MGALDLAKRYDCQRLKKQYIAKCKTMTVLEFSNKEKHTQKKKNKMCISNLWIFKIRYLKKKIHKKPPQ